MNDMENDKRICIYMSAEQGREKAAQLCRQHGILPAMICDDDLQMKMKDIFCCDEDHCGSTGSPEVYFFMQGISHDEFAELYHDISENLPEISGVWAGLTQTNSEWTVADVMAETLRERQVFDAGNILREKMKEVAVLPPESVPLKTRELMLGAFEYLRGYDLKTEILDDYSRKLNRETEKRRAIVIGGANIDICGTADETLNYFDSNPGKISVSYGGVGRNIAQVLCLLGCRVGFTTCFSSDSFGSVLRRDCEDLGMDLTHAMTCDLPTSMYVAVLDHIGEMHLAMSDMRILSQLHPGHLESVLKSAQKDDIIIVDANLDQTCIDYIIENAPCPVAADPVSTVKAHKFTEKLSGISVFKPNIYEAEALTGIVITDRKSAAECLDWFLERGVKEIIISMSSDGVLLGTAEGKKWFRHRKADGNVTGGGDSFLGAYLSARIHGRTPEDAMKDGICAAVLAIEGNAVSRRTLSQRMIGENTGRMRIEETDL